MEKVLVILGERNKEKFITKGFADAFRTLLYFVKEVKVRDINIEAIDKFAPDIVFIFWSKECSKEIIENLINNMSHTSIFIHCSEYNEDIPKIFQNKKSHYCFIPDTKNEKLRYIPSINIDAYECEFGGYRYNITFAGNPYKRENILAAIIKNFGSINIFCRSFDFYKSVEEIERQNILNEYELELYRKSYKGFIETTNELGTIYSSSKINIDIISEPPKEMNYRVREITLCTGFAIVPYTIDIINQYEEGKEIETYKDIYELIDKINFYLKNTQIAKMIAINGKKNTEINFSVNDRLKRMLKVIYGKNFSSRR